jgi:hypothetical protein
MISPSKRPANRVNSASRKAPQAAAGKTQSATIHKSAIGAKRSAQPNRVGKRRLLVSHLLPKWTRSPTSAPAGKQINAFRAIANESHCQVLAPSRIPSALPTTMEGPSTFMPNQNQHRASWLCWSQPKSHDLKSVTRSVASPPMPANIRPEFSVDFFTTFVPNSISSP